MEKMGDEEGSGGKDGKRWGRWVMRKDREERTERDGQRVKIQTVIYLGECLHVASCLYAHYY